MCNCCMLWRGLPVKHVGQSFHSKYPSSLQNILSVDLDLSVSQNIVCPVSSLLSHSYSLLVLTRVQLLVISTRPEVGGILKKSQPIRGQY